SAGGGRTARRTSPRDLRASGSATCSWPARPSCGKERSWKAYGRAAPCARTFADGDGLSPRPEGAKDAARSQGDGGGGARGPADWRGRGSGQGCAVVGRQGVRGAI